MTRAQRLAELQAAADAADAERLATKAAADRAHEAAIKADDSLSDYKAWIEASSATRKAALGLTDEQLATMRDCSPYDLHVALRSMQWAHDMSLIRPVKSGYVTVRFDLTTLGRVAAILARRGREWAS